MKKDKKVENAKVKLKTNIINLKKERSVYVILLLITVLGILLTWQFSKNIDNGFKAFASKFKFESDSSNQVTNASASDLKTLPILLQGMEAVSKETQNGQIIYKTIENPYKYPEEWNGYAKTKDNQIWYWVQRFAFRTVYYKNDEILGYKLAEYFDKDLTTVVEKSHFDEATHFDYEYKILGHGENPKDGEYVLHPAFLKDNTAGNGFWVNVDAYSAEDKTLGQIFNAVETNNGSIISEPILDPTTSEASLINSKEFGALNILNLGNKILNTSNNKYEYVASYLNNGNSLIASQAGSLVESNSKDKNNNYGKALAYPLDTDNDTSINNFEYLSFKAQTFKGDGLYETLGLPNKKTNLVYIDKNKYPEKDKPFFVYSLAEDVERTIGYGQTGQIDPNNLSYRTVIFPKIVENPEQITITFGKTEGSKLYNAQNQEVETVSKTYTKGRVLAKEDITVRAELEGYIFGGWEPDPTGVPLYESQTIMPVFFKDSEETFNVRFVNNITNELYKEVKVKYSQTVPAGEIPPPPSREGYTFIGWTPDPEITAIFEDTNIYPRWKENKTYKLSFFNKPSSQLVLNEKPEFEIDIDASDLKVGETTVNDLIFIKDENGDFKYYLINRFKPTIPNDKVFKGWTPSFSQPLNGSTDFYPILEDKPEPVESEYEKWEKLEKVNIKINDFGKIQSAQRDWQIAKGTSIDQKTLVVRKEDGTNEEVQLFGNIELYNHMNNAAMFDKANYILADIANPANPRFDKPLNIIINEDTEYTVQWERIKIELIFYRGPEKTAEAKEIERVVINSGETFDPTNIRNRIPDNYTNPRGETYGFSKWNIDFTQPITNQNRRYNNGQIHVYPIYQNASTIEKVQISFNFNAGSEDVFIPDRMVFLPRRVDKGTILPPLSPNQEPRRAGYIFEGFSPDLTNPITTDVVFTAQWRKSGSPGPIGPGGPEPYPTPTVWYPEPNPVTPITPSPGGGGPGGVIVDPIDPAKPPGGGTAPGDNPYAGSKSGSLALGTLLTSIASVSFIQIRRINKAVKRNYMLF